MPMPMRQSLRVGSYLMRQKLAGNKKFPLLVELEPLFACNLKCAGCGKIQQPHTILKQRMPVEQAVGAVEESGAPMVSIAGGEPLIHPEIDVIARELMKRKKFVFLCTNAILMKRKLDLFEPSPYFAWAVHIDGLQERHDELEVDEMMISPAYAYDKAPDQEHFPGVRQTRELFSAAFADGGRKRWRLNHSPLFLDFLEGKVDYECTPWGIPSYSIFGWQRPCYLQGDSYAATYRELLEETDWSKYGRHSGNVQCQNCMAHCGYEPTAVLATTHSLKQSLRAFVNS